MLRNNQSSCILLANFTYPTFQYISVYWRCVSFTYNVSDGVTLKKNKFVWQCVNLIYNLNLLDAPHVFFIITEQGNFKKKFKNKFL